MRALRPSRRSNPWTISYTFENLDEPIGLFIIVNLFIILANFLISLIISLFKGCLPKNISKISHQIKKELFFDVFNKIKSIILNLYKRFINLMCKDSIILNIISLIAVCFILYRFIITLSFDIGLLSLIVSFVISFVISTFVLDKFTYSEYIYIRLFQRFLIYLLFLF